MKAAAITLLSLGVLVGCADSDAMTAPDPSATGETAASHNENADFTDQAPAWSFEVTVENLTDGGQYFTPPLITTHRGAARLFRVGRGASTEIQQIAENGNLAPMLAYLGGSRHVSDFVVAASGPGPLAPGASVTVPLTAEPGSRFVSFVSMLICTNDGFTGVSGAKLPEQVGDEVALYLSAYDAGTEINTQDFSDLVPPCPVLSGVATDKMGSGMSDPALAEDGVVHPHPGILAGVGDLDPAIQGWTEPVARLTVRRTH